jgi:hypothetical protein
VRDSAVGCGTALQARTHVRFQMGSLGFFIDLILPAALQPPKSTQPLTEMRTRDLAWAVLEASV